MPTDPQEPVPEHHLKHDESCEDWCPRCIWDRARGLDPDSLARASTVPAWIVPGAECYLKTNAGTWSPARIQEVGAASARCWPQSWVSFDQLLPRSAVDHAGELVEALEAMTHHAQFAIEDDVQGLELDRARALLRELRPNTNTPPTPGEANREEK